MPRKSSKTAHVLNLLTSNKENEASEFDNQLADKSSKKASAKKALSQKSESGNDSKPAEEAKTVAPSNSQPVLDSIVISESEQNVPESVIQNLEINDDIVNAVKEEISPEIIEEIHISKEIEEMAENVADILLEDTAGEPEAPDYEIQTINPIFEKARDYEATAAVSEIQAAASDAISEPPIPAPLSFSPIQPNIIPSPMPKSAVASMLIAQRKADEKKEAVAAQPQEIAEETPVYENEEMTLVNLTEKAATKRIPDIMRKFNMCTCERCYYDVLALTLNGVPQKTVIIPKDDIERKTKEYELDSTVDLITAISKSCVHVKISPRH